MEFALVLPVLLLIVLGGIDFGRVFLGWVSLNNTARIAANYAASNAIQVSAGNTTAIASYRTLVAKDTATTNCTPPTPIPLPAYSPNASLGSTATVTLDCSFSLLTPIISNVFGGAVTVSASAAFPVRTGIVAVAGTGGGSAVVAAFNISPTSGDAPLSVSFNNVSTGTIATWSWDFGDGRTDTAQNPPALTYTIPGTYVITLQVSDGLTTSTSFRTLTVTAPPGPIAAFTFTPTSGTAPLSGVAFTDTSTSSGTITQWVWNMGNGNTYTYATAQNPPNQTYSTANTYTITLTVTDSFGQTSSPAIKTLVVSAVVPTCKVPNFDNDKTDPATITKWTNAGFLAGNILFSPARPPEFTIKSQSLVKNTMLPCATTTITVYNQ